jgi:long-subunit acyl-CoA synthetase (AMP-forming)
MISIAGWFCTGDVGFFDNDGDIFVLDRRENVYNGIRYYIMPSQIEDVLLLHPFVCNVYIIPTLYLNKTHLMIFVEKTDPEAQV